MYLMAQMNRGLVKGFAGLKKAFVEGDIIRHIYKKNVRAGTIDKKGYLVSDELSFTSLSTFTEYHKNSVVGRPISTNGWKECEWKNKDTYWRPAYSKRSL